MAREAEIGATYMSDITELERRITAALERIGAGVEALGQAGATGGGAEDGEVARLTEELAAEREANQQLEERVRAIREKQETIVARLEDEVARLREEVAGHSAEIGRVRRVNAQLRDNNRALREANAAGLPDPHLVNKAMMAELDALRGAREADRAELDAILAELGPVLNHEEGAHA